MEHRSFLQWRFTPHAEHWVGRPCFLLRSRDFPQGHLALYAHVAGVRELGWFELAVECRSGFASRSRLFWGRSSVAQKLCNPLYMKQVGLGRQ